MSSVASPAEPRAQPPLGLRPPYLGLASFGDSDADAAVFCGRSTDTDLVVANLRSAIVTVLYGPSGVGKSSLLHAGVAHRLRTRRDRPPVVVLDDWSGDPAARLTAAVAAAAGGPASLPLTDALARLDEQRTRALLVILDRFEDLLRLHPGESGDVFAAALTTLVDAQRPRVRLLIAVRDDRLADLDRLEGVLPTLFGNVVRLDPLSRAGAAEAISEPLARYNEAARPIGDAPRVSLEDGLGDRVLDELVALSDRGPVRAAPPLGDVTHGDATHGEEADAEAKDGWVEPAFLSLTMRSLWDADIVRDGSTQLRIDTLRRLGGAANIVANHLDATIAALSAREQRLTAAILRALVAPSGATRCLRASDLADYAGRGQPEVEALAEKLGGSPARVLRAVDAPDPSGSHVEYEIAHQVLARPAVEWRRRFETARLHERIRRLVLAVVALAAGAVALVAYGVAPGPLARLELNTVDARFAVRGAQPSDPDIVLVTIGNGAYAGFRAGVPERAAVAAAIGRIAAERPRAIAVDIIFPGSTRPGSSTLLQAVAANGARLVLATTSLDSGFLRSNAPFYGTTLLGTLHATDVTSPAAGWAGVPVDPNEVPAVERLMARSFPIGQAGIPSLRTFALVTARVAGTSPSILNAAPPETWIDFRGGAGTFPAIPFQQVVAGNPTALARVRGRIVVLGVTAAAGGDAAHATSAPGQSVMSGSEVQANAISTAMRGFPLRNAGWLVDVLLIALLGLVPFTVAVRFGALASLGAVVACGILFCVGAQLAFDAGRVVSVVFPLLGLVLAGVGASATDLLVAQTARRGRSAAADPAGR